MTSPQFRFAIIAALVRKIGEIGKIQLQKLIYFLQNSLGVPLGYNFVMHHYGPYCEQIDDNLTIVRALDLVNLSVDPEGYGFHITPGERDISDIPGWASLVEPHVGSIDRITEAFSHYGAWRLELAATIHYVRSLKPEASVSEVLRDVRSQKPKYSREVIRSAYDDVVRLGFINPSP